MIPDLTEQLKSLLCKIACLTEGDFTQILDLIQQGADIEATNKIGSTALMLAAYHNNLSCIVALLAAGAEVNAKNIDDETPLLLVDGDVNCLSALINAGADVNAKNQYGSTALMRAAYLMHIDCVVYLLAAGADVNAQTKDGRTALFYASHCTSSHTLEELQRLQCTIAGYMAWQKDPDNSLIKSIMDHGKALVLNPHTNNMHIDPAEVLPAFLAFKEIATKEYEINIEFIMGFLTNLINNPSLLKVKLKPKLA